MKIVVLSVCDAVDVHLIQRLESAFAGTAIVQVVSGSSSKRTAASPRRSLLSKVSLTKLVGRVDGVVRAWRSERTREKTSRLLFGAPEPPRVRAAMEIAAPTINAPESVERVRALEPDVLFVSGAPILKEPILTVAKIATVNVHYGVAPHYRGENTLFWPLYFGDHERIGVTLHHIDRRIDGGRILAVGFPELSPDDTEATLFAKCARMAAELAVELAHAAARGAIEGTAQEEKGRMFARRDRVFWHDARYLLERRVLRRAPPNAPARVIRYFS